MAGRIAVGRVVTASPKQPFSPSFTACKLSDDITKSVNVKEPKRLDVEISSKTEEELDFDRRHKGLITVEGKNDVATTSGVPEEHLTTRYVRVYRPAKSAMQSGTAGVRRWRIEFETRERWENNLMGWASSGDPLSNMIVDFASKEEAVAFVEKHGWDYWVEDPKERSPKVKSYALNFAWNKRTRKSTK